MPPSLVRVTCTGCKREWTLTPERAASRPKCIYCGEALAIAANDVARVADASQRTSAAPTSPRRAKVAATCPVCSRRTVFDGERAGTDGACMYCGCPFAVPAATGTPAPGGLGCEFVDSPTRAIRDAGVLPLEIRRLVDLEPLLALGTNVGVPQRLARLALTALAARGMRRHATEDEMRNASQRVWHVGTTASQHSPDRSSPLTPEEAAEIVSRVTASGGDATVNAREIDGVLVRISTGEHREVTGDLPSGGALGMELLTGIALGRGYSNASVREFVVRHYLRVALHRQPNGCALSYSNEHQTGETHPIEPDQLDWMARIPRDLQSTALRYVSLRAIWGPWFRGTQLVALSTTALAEWLMRLGLGAELQDDEVMRALAR